MLQEKINKLEQSIQQSYGNSAAKYSGTKK